MATYGILRCAILAAIVASTGCSQGKKTDLSGKLAWSNSDGIYIWDFSGGDTEGKELLSARSACSGLTMSSDGRYICYIYTDWFAAEEKPVYSLLRICLDGGITDTLVSGTQRLGDPAFSPDNTRIAFWLLGKSRIIKPRGQSTPEVIGPPEASCAMFDVETKEYRVITESDFYPSTPSWTPDGNSMWVSSYEGRIVRIDLEGGEMESFGRGFWPAISPDGRYLAYLDLDGQSIYVVNLKSGTKRALTSRFTYHAPMDYSAHICWSPDSQYLLYECWTGMNRIVGWSSGFVVTPAHHEGLPIALGTKTGHSYGVDWVP